MTVFKLLLVAGGAVLFYAVVLGVCLTSVDFTSWNTGKEPRSSDRDRSGPAR